MHTVALDPGHPSSPGDTGAQSSCGRIVECDYTISIVRMLKTAIESTGEPLEPVLLRTRNDEVVKVSERARRATDAGAELVLSVHVDSWVSPAHRGGTALYWPGNEDGRVIADQIASSMPPALRRSSRGSPAHHHLWPRARNVLGAYQQTAVLLECGYASNPDDVAALLEPSVQVQIVGALMQGLRLFRQMREAHWLKE